MEKFNYEECKEYLKNFKIKSSFDFYKKQKSCTFDIRVPKRPYEYYRTKKRNVWISWEDLLTIDKSSNFEKYLNFEDSKRLIQSLNFKNKKEFLEYFKNNKFFEMKIPSNPNKTYKYNGWISFPDWLGLKNYKNLRKIEYLSYNDCKKIIKNKFPEITNGSDWRKFDKNRLPINVPKRLITSIKKQMNGKVGNFFLDSDISPKSKSKILLSFEEAKNYLRNLCLKDRYDYIKYIKENKINILPKRPDHCYREHWSGYIDYLNCERNKTSIGERLICEFLDDKEIHYEREKKFTNCKNIKPLPFDFYLPEKNICIEYDGELHFKSVEQFGGEKELLNRKNNDDIKTNWCEENKIKLIRIHYLKKNKIYQILDKLI